MTLKIASLIALLSLTAVVVHVRGEQDRIVPAAELSGLPFRIGQFAGTEQIITPDVLQVLGDGRFLSRSYGDANRPTEPPVDLLIAYYPTQRNGQSIHSPQNCLPGAGWTFEQSGTVSFQDALQQPHRVAEYRVSNGGTQMEVLYWYRSRGRDIPSDYGAKAFLMVQAIRDGRTDGGLVRLMTPMRPHESQESARSRILAFASSLDPLLAPYLPT